MMGLFGRRKETLNERLLREAGLDVAEPPASESAVEEPESTWGPGSLGERERPFESPFMPAPPASVTSPLGRRRAWEGFQREREFDAIATAEAPSLRGDEVEFVALPGGDLLVLDEEGDATLAPLAEAIERSVAPPYRARAVRTSGSLWSVAANRIAVVQMDADGDSVDVALHAGERSATVDGIPTSRRFPELERLGERQGADYAIYAERLDGDLWQARVAAL
jgi:hypothetical protein